MAEYLGRAWKKQELISLIGDPQQIAEEAVTLHGD
jgi:hypothetical protein